MGKRICAGEWRFAPKVIDKVGEPSPRALPFHYRVCSICGTLAPHAGDHIYRFCPFCGASMKYPDDLKERMAEARKHANY